MSDNLLGLLEQARTHLVTFSDQLQQVFVKADYYNAFSADAIAADKKQQALIDLFGIRFTRTSDKIDLSLERIGNVYQAVQDIARKLGGEDDLANIFLFIQVFGTVTVELSGKDPEGKGAFASTSADGTIHLYTEETSRPHTPANIVHEFGHLLVLRHGGDKSGIFQQWDTKFRQAISDFDTKLGWKNGLDDLQNTLGLADFGGETSELENERIANMFERWINGSRSDLNLDSEDDREKRAAWAMWSFMTGECPPEDFKIRLGEGIDVVQPPCGEGTGFLYWLRQYGG